MPPLVVTECIASFNLNPLGNGKILHLFLGQEPLDPESLMIRYSKEQSQLHTPCCQRKGEPVTLLKAVLEYWYKPNAKGNKNDYSWLSMNTETSLLGFKS